jgi:hypothetical protein
MPGLVLSRSKNGVASLAYGIHVFLLLSQDVDGRDEPGHDEQLIPHTLKSAAARRA